MYKHEHLIENKYFFIYAQHERDDVRHTISPNQLEDTTKDLYCDVEVFKTQLLHSRTFNIGGWDYWIEEVEGQND